MNRKNMLMLVICLLMFALPACTCAPLANLPFFNKDKITPTMNIKNNQADYQATVNALNSLLDAQQLPSHFTTDTPQRDGSEFDLNRVFDVLDHLTMQPGWMLDYVYLYDRMGGFPVIYARQQNAPPLKTFADYEQLEQSQCQAGDQNPCNYWMYLEIDGTEAGYFQFVAFLLNINQFYLFWHANYNDVCIVASQADLDDIIDMINTTGVEPLSKADHDTAMALDPTARITIEADKVTVRVLTFTQWGGFDEYIYILDKANPTHSISRTINHLLDYDCGIMF